MAWLVPVLPAVAALVGWALARRAAVWVAVVGTGAALVVAVPLVVATAGRGERAETSHLIAPNGGVAAAASTLADGLAGILALLVCVVALLVQVYSIDYLADDPRYPAYAAEVSLFTAAMLAVVLAGDLLVLLIGWEVMGLCSYLLIGHYRDLPEAPGAALKAFLVTRVGDVGFLLGILLLGLTAGTFRISGVLAAVPSFPPRTLTLATLLLLLGVAGKSAQFPLHTWLPDAMAGPTPISALIHAATMVAAGVYLVLRLYPAFVAAPASLAVLGCLAAITMLLGALAALAQDDLKRVLAWSTVSQLAYMLGALAVGGYAAGAFHLITHAAFKALLFLCAGVVLHGTGTVLMSRLGGLRRALPVTYVATVLGGLALAGVPPLSGGLRAPGPARGDPMGGGPGAGQRAGDGAADGGVPDPGGAPDVPRRVAFGQCGARAGPVDGRPGAAAGAGRGRGRRHRPARLLAADLARRTRRVAPPAGRDDRARGRAGRDRCRRGRRRLAPRPRGRPGPWPGNGHPPGRLLP
jgi:NADH-quinone oxidoreductase subunit L